MPIPGTTWMERAKENFGALDLELTVDEMKDIEKVLSLMDIVGMKNV